MDQSLNDSVTTSEQIRKYFPSLAEPELREEIALNGILHSYDTGEVIMDYGKYIKSIPMVMEGCIKILRKDDQGHELFLYYLNKGDTCAMSLTCCIAYSKSEIRAVAEEPTQIISIPVKFMDQWISKYPSWRQYVLNTYGVRFNELLTTIDNVAFMRLDERLVRYLREKDKVQNNSNLNISHQEIADELNTSRVVISRLLKQLERDGKIELYRHRIKILSL